jgi:PKD domain/Secretion system C-terminal sorting domain
MKKLLLCFLVLISLAYSPAVSAQCPNDNVLIAGDLTPPGVSLSTMLTYNSGQYVTAFVYSGANYTISTCGSSAFDSQLTVYNNANAAFIAYNDDACSVQSTVNFTPNFCGYVRVLLDLYFCASGVGNSSMDVTMTMNTAATAVPSLTASPNTSACFGSTTVIGIPNNGSGGTSPYTYSWTPTINLANPTQSSTTATVTATQTYVLTLTDAAGCPARDTVLVSVLPAPTVNLGVDTTICGGPFVLDAGNPGSTYLWSTGAGTQTISVTNGGSYSVVVQDPSGCTNTDNIIVAFNALPIVSLGNDTTTCSNLLMLDAGAGFSAYTWSTGGSAQTEGIPASDTVSVIVTDSNGCMNTDTVVVTLSPPPVVNLGADITQCGGTVTLDAGNPGSLYFWSNVTSSQTTTVSTSGTYAVLVVTPAGCTNTDTILVTINNQPIVNLGPNLSVCTPTVLLDAGNPGSTYAWSNFQTTQTTTVGPGTYHVVVTDVSGCSASDTIVVVTNSTPNISAGPDQDICLPQGATLTATGGVSYLWSDGSTTVSTNVTPGVTTAYYVLGTDANGCTSTDIVMVNILPASNALFTANVIGATGVFTNQSTNAVSYSWNFGDTSPLDNGANPSHTYGANGTYTVTLTVTGPCGTDTYTQVITISQVGLQDNDLASTLNLFPNPNDGRFTIAFEFSKAKDVTIEIMDVAGRIIYSEQSSDVTSYRKEIGLASIESGVYQVRIITNEGVVTKKIVVQQ